MQIALSCLVAVVALSVQANGAGIGSTIIGGSAVTNIAEFPAVVAIFRKDGTAPLEYKCTGIVINNDTVLTVATCISNINGREPTVVIGATTNAGGAPAGQHIKGKTLIPHPQFGVYGSEDYNYNVGIIKLARSLDPATDAAKPVAIASNTTVIPATGTKVVGWGKPAADGAVATTLKKADMTLATEAVCIARKNVAIDPKYHVCTAATAALTPTVGDWGSPLYTTGANNYTDMEGTTVHGLLYAIGDANEAVAFIRLSEHSDWIQKAAKPAPPAAGFYDY